MRLRPVGQHALLVELADGAEAEALHAELHRRRAAGILPEMHDIVPGARTVLLDGVAHPEQLAADLPHWSLPAADHTDRPLVEVPTRYEGPDIEQVAALWETTPEQVARTHADTVFQVAFCGFMPGFGYLTGLPTELQVPRRDEPRTRVPAGAVGLAGGYTGIYPRSAPGGWQLIGTTDALLWDPEREPAALLAPGTRVRFVPDDGGGGRVPLQGEACQSSRRGQRGEASR